MKRRILLLLQLAGYSIMYVLSSVFYCFWASLGILAIIKGYNMCSTNYWVGGIYIIIGTALCTWECNWLYKKINKDEK